MTERTLKEFKAAASRGRLSSSAHTLCSGAPKGKVPGWEVLVIGVKFIVPRLKSTNTATQMMQQNSVARSLFSSIAYSWTLTKGCSSFINDGELPVPAEQGHPEVHTSS